MKFEILGRRQVAFVAERLTDLVSLSLCRLRPMALRSLRALLVLFSLHSGLRTEPLFNKRSSTGLIVSFADFPLNEGQDRE